jgi:hypothetical protein
MTAARSSSDSKRRVVGGTGGGIALLGLLRGAGMAAPLGLGGGRLGLGGGKAGLEEVV